MSEIVSKEYEEMQFYPYYILCGYSKLPFQNPNERVEANSAIDDFVDIIELERERSESLAKKIKDIDFEVLLSRPPEGKYDKYV